MNLTNEDFVTALECDFCKVIHSVGLHCNTPELEQTAIDHFVSGGWTKINTCHIRCPICTKDGRGE